MDLDFLEDPRPELEEDHEWWLTLMYQIEREQLAFFWGLRAMSYRIRRHEKGLRLVATIDPTIGFESEDDMMGYQKEVLIPRASQIRDVLAHLYREVEKAERAEKTAKTAKAATATATAPARATARATEKVDYRIDPRPDLNEDAWIWGFLLKRIDDARRKDLWEARKNGAVMQQDGRTAPPLGTHLEQAVRDLYSKIR